jgi:hypothetical protein
MKGPPGDLTVHWLGSSFYPARATATVASPAGPPSTRARAGTGMPAAALPPPSLIACSVPAGATLPGPRTLPACGHHHDAAGPLPVPCQKRPVSLAHERQNPARATSMETPVVVYVPDLLALESGPGISKAALSGSGRCRSGQVINLAWRDHRTKSTADPGAPGARTHRSCRYSCWNGFQEPCAGSGTNVCL